MYGIYRYIDKLLLLSFYLWCEWAEPLNGRESNYEITKESLRSEFRRNHKTRLQSGTMFVFSLRACPGRSGRHGVQVIRPPGTGDLETRAVAPDDSDSVAGRLPRRAPATSIERSRPGAGMSLQETTNANRGAAAAKKKQQRFTTRDGFQRDMASVMLAFKQLACQAWLASVLAEPAADDATKSAGASTGFSRGTAASAMSSAIESMDSEHGAPPPTQPPATVQSPVCTPRQCARVGARDSEERRREGTGGGEKRGGGTRGRRT